MTEDQHKTVSYTLNSISFHEYFLFHGNSLIDVRVNNNVPNTVKAHRYRATKWLQATNNERGKEDKQIKYNCFRFAQLGDLGSKNTLTR